MKKIYLWALVTTLCSNVCLNTFGQYIDTMTVEKSTVLKYYGEPYKGDAKVLFRALPDSVKGNIAGNGTIMALRLQPRKAASPEVVLFALTSDSLWMQIGRFQAPFRSFVSLSPSKHLLRLGDYFPIDIEQEGEKWYTRFNNSDPYIK